MTRARAGWLVALAAVLGAAAPARADRDFDDLLKAHFIHCAFFRNSGAPDEAQDERKAEVLVHYQGIDMRRESARMISTRSTGIHPVRVVRTANAVHFIESTAGLFVMTTVFGCNERDRRPGKHPCITYGAAYLQLLDPQVVTQPDRVFESNRHLASHGFCDHSFFGVN